MDEVSYANLNLTELFIRLVITIVISHLVLVGSQSRLLGPPPLCNTKKSFRINRPSQVAVNSFVETWFEAFKNTHWELSFLNQLVKRGCLLCIIVCNSFDCFASSDNTDKLQCSVYPNRELFSVHCY